ncbi:MAG TPA: serine/threonine-protein kinase, partial [Anaeromyxobacteraceae bacterium]
MSPVEGALPPDEPEGGGARRPEDALSALLRELARAPPVAEVGWERLLAPGAVIGRFELLRRVGQGGFGVVFEAEDRELHRRVAFKALRPNAGGGAPWLAEEAEAVARLNHPGIVTLYDMGTCDAGPYLVLELLRGETLAVRLARGPLPPEAALAIAVRVASALAHAHAARVVHRDLKPGNVFLTEEGGVKLLDFGIAHVLGRDLKSAGTPAFMAPEQRGGGAESPAVDVYAVGALLVTMLGGGPPRDEGTPARYPAGTPRPLVDVIERALQADPAHRPADGAALCEALQEAAAALP